MTTLRVAVVGAGPAGLYVADGLCFDPDREVRVDLIDRLPTPFGLLRYGVAPDHSRMKALIRTLEQVLRDSRVRFLGNVELGRDVRVQELRAHYDAVVYATGAPGERRLDIPGEDLDGSVSAGDVVGWYSGHPDSDGSFSLGTDAAVVVGAGNVALDVARLLCKDVDELARTDIPSEVIVSLRASRVRDVHLLCRRGPTETRFTSKELRGLGELSGVDVVVDPGDLALSEAEAVTGAQARNLALLRAWAARPSTAAPRRVHLHFWCRPVALFGTKSVESVTVERTTVYDGQLVGTGEVRSLSCGLVVRSAGFQAIPLPGVPWDAGTSRVPHRDGRLLRDGQVSPGEFVAGWAARGAAGVLGTNRPDADRVVAHLDQLTCRTMNPVDLVDLLTDRGAVVVPVEGWEAIDRLECRRGREQGREREKVSDWPTLLGAARADAGALA